MLLYGAGLRLEECVELRVKDLDFDGHQITVRQGKGRRDRVTMLPTAAREGLAAHLAGVRRIHEADLARGFGRVVMPFALDRKFPTAPTEWRWQFGRPASAGIRDSGCRRGITSTSPSCRRLWPRLRGRLASPNVSART